MAFQVFFPEGNNVQVNNKNYGYNIKSKIMEQLRLSDKSLSKFKT